MAAILSDTMVPSESTLDEKSSKGNTTDNQQKQNCAKSEKTCVIKQEPDQAASTTPRSSSSTNSTTSSGRAVTSGANSGATHTMGKFKEKRPEPLNLNPNLNQEIPLDLSVKSAGNMPSGRSVNTLETPRIFWLDNEALLIKPRLYSSSTSASQRVRLSSLAGDSPPITPNTPFMDLVCSPTTKLPADYHSNSASMLLDSNSSLHSLLSAQYQYSKHHRHQFDDNHLTTPATNKPTPTNRFLVHHFKGNNEIIRTPRRSCSTDNLSTLGCNGHLPTFKGLQSYRSQQQQYSNQRLSLQQQNTDGKKNSISPLATKNLSSSKSGCNRFSYSGCQQIANCDLTTPAQTIGYNDDNAKGIANVIGDQSQSSDNRTIASGNTCIPTSVANATANLLNIHLNSPTNQGQALMDGLTSTIGSITSINDLLAAQKSPTLGEYRSTTDQNMDPLISAAYCQQHHQNQILRSSLTSSTSSFSGVENQLDKQQSILAPVYCQRSPNLTGMVSNGLTTLSSSTTLNTPTLVSPSQLKSGSSICFLPSPLSPMSSVFELPSPLLMFPPPTSSSGQNLLPHVGFGGSSGSEHTRGNSKNSSPLSKTTQESNTAEQEAQLRDREEYKGKSLDNAQCASGTATNYAIAEGEANLSLLVTSARDKVDDVDVDDEVSLDNMRMEIDTQEMISSSADIQPLNNLKDDQMALLDNSHNIQARPSTVIPRILVSDSCRSRRHQQQQQPTQIQYQENQRPTYRDGVYAQLQQLQQQSNGTIGDVNYHNQAQSQYRVQRDIVDKRALSPQSFRARVSVYHNERIESSSAPPVIYQSRARSKIKSATEPCIVPEPDEQQPPQQHQHQSDLCFRSQGYQSNSSQNQAGYHGQHYKTNALYPELQNHWPPPQTGHQQQGLAIKTGSLRPSSAEPRSSLYLPGQHLGDSLHQFDATSTGHQQYHHNIYQQHPAQQISTLGQNFSHSEQHLRPDRMDIKPCMPERIVQHQQCYSASVGELNRYQMNCGSFVGPATNHHHQMSTVATVQQQQTYVHPATRNAVASNLLALHNSNNHVQSPMQVKIDDMIDQPPIPIQIVPSSLSFNQLAQGHEAQFHECNESLDSPGQRQPRALSAEIRGMSRSESSCSSVDFCFRSNSAASSGSTAKKYQCDQCSKAFTRSDMLTRHKRLHSGDRPFQCNECKQEFSRSDHLSTHMRTHTGEKPYKCKLCSYSACRKDMITRHMKVHNRSSPNVQPMERD